jgi:Na+/H+ antiporter NhaD/arsenite permease-like protein
MITAIIIVFIIGYACIAFEEFIYVNKAASALITGVLCWTLYILSNNDTKAIDTALMHHFSDIASILFFLLGAMTIVELIDAHHGFDVLTEKIKLRKATHLLWVIGILSFILSAVLDNLTTTIVMVSLTGKLVSDKSTRLWFAGIIIICANFGGAWSPIGDVTTTMLWIGGQITALQIMKSLILPSFLGAIVPLLIVHYKLRNTLVIPVHTVNVEMHQRREGRIILVLGISLLLMVPIFKTVTHLPPFMGILLALGIIWVVTTLLHKSKNEEYKAQFNVAKALQRIDTPSILFFAGILLSVAALQTAGILPNFASQLFTLLGNEYYIGTGLGLLSAIVDNVPLVAATQHMYSLQQFPTDHPFWEFIALTTGSGGSIIIIGSAAGVAAMGIENISFSWYLKNIAWIALVGFVIGILIFYLLHSS